jgi:hypothetical protein
MKGSAPAPAETRLLPTVFAPSLAIAEQLKDQSPDAIEEPLP